MLFNTILNDHEYTRLKYKTDFQSINPYTRYRSDFTIPSQFDPRERWKDYLSPVLNQKQCGSCYAFAWASCLSDRLALLSNNEIHTTITATNITICPLPSPGQDLVLSDFNKTNTIDLNKRIALEKSEQTSHSCNGNNLIIPAKFLYYVGGTTTDCVPDNLIEKGVNLPTCESTEDTTHNLTFSGCYNSTKAQRDFRLLYLYTLNLENETTKELNIQYELFKFGPVCTGFYIFEDFYKYSNKLKKDPTHIYIPSPSKVLGGHSVSIVGYGEKIQDGVLIKYWLVRNSWGDDWGDKGYFRIVRWNNSTKIESNIICGIPDLPNTQDLDLPTLVGQSSVPNLSEQQLRNKYVVDPKTFYSIATIDSIKKGLLTGSLQPIFLERNLPNVNTLVVGKLQSINYIKYSITVIIIIVIISVICTSK